MIRGFYRVFSFRRRNIDPLVVASVPLLFVLNPSTIVIVSAIFAIMGIWLICGKHESSRYGSQSLNWFGLIVAAYIIARLLLDFFNSGKVEMICTPYQAYLALVGPIAVGLVLVRDPLRIMIIGCRLGIAMISLYSAYLILTVGNLRVGFGTNPLIAGYVLIIFACLARFPLRSNESPWLGLLIFYSGFLIVAVTSNRIFVVFYILVFLLDIGRVAYYWIKKNKADLRSALLLGAGLVAAISAIVIFGERFRIEKTIFLFSEGAITDQSFLTRLNMWKLGLEVFYQQPFFGVGQCNIPDLTFSYLQDVQKVNLSFNHLHNAFVHELAVHGILGFALVGSFHVLIFRYIYRHLNTVDQRWSLMIFFLCMFIYDLTGTHLSDDRMMSATILVLGVFVAESGRVRHKQKLNVEAN